MSEPTNYDATVVDPDVFQDFDIPAILAKKPEERTEEESWIKAMYDRYEKEVADASHEANASYMYDLMHYGTVNWELEKALVEGVEEAENLTDSLSTSVDSSTSEVVVEIARGDWVVSDSDHSNDTRKIQVKLPLSSSVEGGPTKEQMALSAKTMVLGVEIRKKVVGVLNRLGSVSRDVELYHTYRQDIVRTILDCVAKSMAEYDSVSNKVSFPGKFKHANLMRSDLVSSSEGKFSQSVSMVRRLLAVVKEIRAIEAMLEDLKLLKSQLPE